MVSYLFILCFLATGLYAASSIEIHPAGKIVLSQTKTILGAVEGFAKTEDDVFVVPDYKEGNIKLFDDHGELIKVLGRKGPGPLDFGSPRNCDYCAPLLAISDFGRQRIFVYRKVGHTNFEKVSDFPLPVLDKIYPKLMEDQILIPGYVAVSDKKQYGLYTIDLSRGQLRYILPIETKYGFSSLNEFESKKGSLLSLGSTAYCDVFGGSILFVWEGNLRIIKIDKATNAFVTFGKKPANYIKPKVTRALEEAFQTLSAKDVETEYSKMSFINGLFADKDFVGVIYQNFDEKTSLWKMYVQFYSPRGELLKEIDLPEAETYISFRANTSYYDRAKRALYFLSITYDQKTTLDQYKIMKYKID
jgi:hypothetical protein